MLKKRRFGKKPMLPYYQRRKLKQLSKQILLPIFLLQLGRTLLLPTTFDIFLLSIFLALYLMALLK